MCCNWVCLKDWNILLFAVSTRAATEWRHAWPTPEPGAAGTLRKSKKCVRIANYFLLKTFFGEAIPKTFSLRVCGAQCSKTPNNVFKKDEAREDPNNVFSKRCKSHRNFTAWKSNFKSKLQKNVFTFVNRQTETCRGFGVCVRGPVCWQDWKNVLSRWLMVSMGAMPSTIRHRTQHVFRKKCFLVLSTSPKKCFQLENEIEN